MTLSGSQRVTVRPRGGVTKVELVAASKFARVAFDPATGCPTGIETSEDPAEYVFCEDRAQYGETITVKDLQPMVKHTLEMELAGGASARRSIEELSLLSVEGVVAVITLASGESAVAGWSARFGTGYPLRVTKIVSVSGSDPADLPTVALTLESEDADPSLTL